MLTWHWEEGNWDQQFLESHLGGHPTQACPEGISKGHVSGENHQNATLVQAGKSVDSVRLAWL